MHSTLNFKSSQHQHPHLLSMSRNIIIDKLLSKSKVSKRENIGLSTLLKENIVKEMF